MREIGIIGRALLVAGIILSCASTAVLAASTKTVIGKSQRLGQGSANMYAAFDEKGAPLAFGFNFSKGALQGLPTTPNPKSLCVDANGDGKTDLASECLGDYSLIFAMPEGAAAMAPFKWPWSTGTRTGIKHRRRHPGRRPTSTSISMSPTAPRWRHCGRESVPSCSIARTSSAPGS
ncbi:MAG: hypothetical protein EXQ96_01065 [Alphaproteobacteria bacterium]|nr:hypothetical protein [Alphaproteobacteria bacterium]